MSDKIVPTRTLMRFAGHSTLTLRQDAAIRYHKEAGQGQVFLVVEMDPLQG